VHMSRFDVLAILLVYKEVEVGPLNVSDYYHSESVVAYSFTNS
jgi:hypothetical protein